MKTITYTLPVDIDKSFTVHAERGACFDSTWHNHKEYELILIIKSGGIRIVGDHIGCFEEGDLVFMGPSLPHVWINHKDYVNGRALTEANAVVVHFSKDFLFTKLAGLSELNSLNSMLLHAKRGVVFKGNTKNEINRLLKGLLQQNGLGRLASLFSIFNILSYKPEFELLASPAYCLGECNSSQVRSSKINAYILDHCHRTIPLQEIAAAVGMAPTTFCNFFKAHYRMTFIEYVNSIRIGHVCKRLMDTDESVQNIAYACGFNTMANFNAHFKRIKGVSPKEYRKIVLTNLVST